MLGTDIENDEAANEVEANKGLQLGKVSAILGKLQLGKVSVILGKERILSWKGKDPFLSQERSSLQLGKVSVILGKERILSFPRKGVVCNWERIQSFWESSKGERKGKDSYPPMNFIY